MILKVNGIEKTRMDRAAAIMYEGFFRKKEIGSIGITANVESDYFKIEYFKVKESKRNKGVGRKLLNAMIQQMKRVGGHSLIVFPNSEPYEKDKDVENEKLYEIYQRLGFSFEQKDVDLHKADHKMIMRL